MERCDAMLGERLETSGPRVGLWRARAERRKYFHAKPVHSPKVFLWNQASKCKAMVWPAALNQGLDLMSRFPDHFWLVRTTCRRRRLWAWRAQLSKTLKDQGLRWYLGCHWYTVRKCYDTD